MLEIVGVSSASAVGVPTLDVPPPAGIQAGDLQIICIVTSMNLAWVDDNSWRLDAGTGSSSEIGIWPARTVALNVVSGVDHANITPADLVDDLGDVTVSARAWDNTYPDADIAAVRIALRGTSYAFHREPGSDSYGPGVPNGTDVPVAAKPGNPGFIFAGIWGRRQTSEYASGFAGTTPSALAPFDSIVADSAGISFSALVGAPGPAGIDDLTIAMSGEAAHYRSTIFGVSETRPDPICSRPILIESTVAASGDGIPFTLPVPPGTIETDGQIIIIAEERFDDSDVARSTLSGDWEPSLDLYGRTGSNLHDAPNLHVYFDLDGGDLDDVTITPPGVVNVLARRISFATRSGTMVHGMVAEAFSADADPPVLAYQSGQVLDHTDLSHPTRYITFLGAQRHATSWSINTPPDAEIKWVQARDNILLGVIFHDEYDPWYGLPPKSASIASSKYKTYTTGLRDPVKAGNKPGSGGPSVGFITVGGPSIIDPCLALPVEESEVRELYELTYG